jgi:hypothetical protein
MLDKFDEIKLEGGETVPLEYLKKYLKEALQLDMMTNFINGVTLSLIAGKKVKEENVKDILSKLIPDHSHTIKEIENTSNLATTEYVENQISKTLTPSNVDEIVTNKIKGINFQAFKVLPTELSQNYNGIKKELSQLSNTLSQNIKDIEVIKEVERKVKILQDDCSSLVRNIRDLGSNNKKIDLKEIEKNVLKQISSELGKYEAEGEKGKYYRTFKVFTQNYDGLVPKPTAADVAANKVLRADGTWATAGGGGGAVDSVNGQTGVVTIDLQSVTDVDNETTNPILINNTTGLGLYDNPNAEYGYVNLSDSIFSLRNTTSTGGFQLENSTEFSANFSAPLTEDRAYTIPNNSGTLALTSDIPSLTGYLQNNVGIAGGTTLIGGTASANNLTLSSTSDATKGAIIFGTASEYDEATDRFGYGTLTPAGKQHIVFNSLGVTPTLASAHILENTTAAAAGAQQVSPPVYWRGQGWKTTATAASQNVDYRAFVLPVQGAANPTGLWKLQASINGAAFADVMTVSDTGNVTSAGGFTTSFSVSAFNGVFSGLVRAGGASTIGWASSTSMKAPSDGVLTLLNNAETGFTRLNLGGTTSSFVSIKRNTTQIDFRNGDDTAYCAIQAATITGTTGTFTQGSSGTTLSATNTRNSASNTAASFVVSGTGTNSTAVVANVTGGTNRIGVLIGAGSTPTGTWDLYGTTSGANNSLLGNLVVGSNTATTARLGVVDTTLAGSGSLAGSLVDMTQTWNTSGAPTAIKLNVTNTASGAAQLMDLQVDGVSQFAVSKAGALTSVGVAVPTISSTNTLTNKRITPRTGTTTSSATPTINTDNVDFYSLTAQTTDITSFTTNLSGTPTDGQKLWISVTGTASRAITWGSSFEASTIALPTTTVSTNRLDVGFVWNPATSKWRCVGTC